jgi:hypothetical protein
VVAQYAVLIFERVAPADLPAEVMQGHQDLPARVAEQGGRIVAGLALEPPDTATAIRGETLTDGPFIETKEVLGGVFVLEARDLDHALALLIEPADANPPDPDVDAIPDDRLRLIFTCCHPALALEAQVALTLRLVCGIATPDVAHAFLVSETTMAARLTRAKKKIAAARIRYAVPAVDELPARVDAALTVIHLLHTTGYTARTGEELVRDELNGRRRRGRQRRPPRDRRARARPADHARQAAAVSASGS